MIRRLHRGVPEKTARGIKFGSRTLEPLTKVSYRRKQVIAYEEENSDVDDVQRFVRRYFQASNQACHNRP